MSKSKVKKLIEKYLKKSHNLKVVNINETKNIWIAVDKLCVPYEIFIDYGDKAFTITRLSTVCFHKTMYYGYDKFGVITRL